ncbi:transposase [Streptomyces sp. ISL-44]|nr:transposase [Streptomyces sp. ISL-44]
MVGMGRGDLSDAERERLQPFLPVSNRRCGRWRDHRQVIDGILHRVRTGVQWRDLPERFGPWKTVYERHRRWWSFSGYTGSSLTSHTKMAGVVWAPHDQVMMGRCLFGRTRAQGNAADGTGAGLAHHVAGAGDGHHGRCPGACRGR